MIRNVPAPEPTCGICRRWLPPNSQRKYCSDECSRAARAQACARWRAQQDPEVLAAKLRDWRAKQPPEYQEQRAAKDREWWLKNREYLSRPAQRAHRAEIVREYRARKAKQALAPARAIRAQKVRERRRRQAEAEVLRKVLGEVGTGHDDRGMG